ncbi:hypothetical protein [Pseudarthrobacter sp. NPDC080039]|uniref:hypothetical protein n=1 Tax=unclassified Pseudarthrobacter TaxID=2647000 RepID=UPI00344F8CE1
MLLPATVLPDRVGCVLVCVACLPSEGLAPLPVGMSSSATALVRADQNGDDGPVSQALTGHPALTADHYTSGSPWRTHWRSFGEAGCRSLPSVPVTLEPARFAALTFLAGKDNVNVFTRQHRSINKPVLPEASSGTRRAGPR